MLTNFEYLTHKNKRFMLSKLYMFDAMIIVQTVLVYSVILD